MRITRITKIRNYRIFKEYQWPSELPDFGRFNLIYGWNGSGKTTLSGLFRAMEKRSAVPDGDVGFQVDRQSISARDFHTASLPTIRVFNRDTVDRAVFESANGQLPPVFYLGEDSVEKQKKVEALRRQESELVAKIASIQGEKRAAEKLYEDFCANKAQEIKLLLTRQNGGPYNNYNAKTFKVSADRRALLGLALLSEEQRDQYKAIADGKLLPSLSVGAKPPIDVMALMDRARVVLERQVESKKIQELLDRPDVASWVGVGMPLHKKYESSACLFCGSEISESRISAINDHFNDAVRTLNSDIAQLAAGIESAKRQLAALTFPSKSDLYPHLSGRYEAELSKFKTFQRALDTFLGLIYDALEAKRNLPFSALNIADYLGPKVDSKKDGVLLSIFKVVIAISNPVGALWAESSLGRIAEIVKSHNDHSDSFSAELAGAQKALEDDYVSRSYEEYLSRHATVRAFSDSEDTERSSLETIRKDISQLESQIVEHRRPADELNAELEAYLGHGDLTFEVLSNGYRVSRKGDPAQNLSDGERTAIAFMYFLKSLEGKDFDIEDGIVVIDDPISSLDANSIYSAFSFMKDRLMHAGQVFVLTHNFTFFKLVKNWLIHLARLGQSPKNFEKSAERGVCFYMLRSFRSGGVRQSELSKLDNLLFRYESDYHYLFNLVYTAATDNDPGSFEKYYSLPNISRRMLEVVLAFKDPIHIGHLHEQLENVPYEPSSTKTRVIRFLHINSHGDRIGESEHDLSLLSEAGSVMLDVLRLVRAIDPQHYERMVQSIGATPVDLDALPV